VAGDATAYVAVGNAGFVAEGRDEAPVDEGASDPGAAVGEQEMDVVAGLVVGEGGLGWAHQFPGFDGRADGSVDWLGERRAGLVDRDVEQAYLRLVVAAVALPADGTDAQATDLVGAQPGEEPQQGDGADEFDGIQTSPMER
jgi:hypothetical protein